MAHYLIFGVMIVYIIFTLYINEKSNRKQVAQEDTEPVVNIKPKRRHKNNILYLENYKRTSDGRN